MINWWKTETGKYTSVTFDCSNHSYWLPITLRGYHLVISALCIFLSKGNPNYTYLAAILCTSEGEISVRYCHNRIPCWIISGNIDSYFFPNDRNFANCKLYDGYIFIIKNSQLKDTRNIIVPHYPGWCLPVSL